MTSNTNLTENAICLKGTAMRDPSHHGHTSHRTPVTIILDSGAHSCIMSARTARHAKVRIEPFQETIEGVGGARVLVLGIATVQLNIGSYRTRMKFKILDDSRFNSFYDILLGMNWLRGVNPVINWSKMTVKVRDEQGRVHDLPTTQYDLGKESVGACRPTDRDRSSRYQSDTHRRPGDYGRRSHPDKKGSDRARSGSNDLFANALHLFTGMFNQGGYTGRRK